MENKSIHNADDEVYKFLERKKIRSLNHLPTGASTSPLLCFLAYKEMFEEIKREADKRNYLMSVYVDDITFSSISSIDKGFIKRCEKIVSRYYHRVNTKKTRYYSITEHKNITGTILSKNHELKIQSRIHKDIVDLFEKVKSGEYTTKELKQLKGKLSYARMIRKNCFPNI